jgi:microcompartment protein CcmL/EutN
MVGHHIINNVHESLPAAILGVTEVEKIAAIGVIETISALSAVNAADVAAKAAKVDMLEVRIARGLGGKGFLVFTGEVSAVRSAVKACANMMGETGEITSHCVLPAPHADLVKQILAQ